MKLLGALSVFAALSLLASCVSTPPAKSEPSATVQASASSSARASSNSALANGLAVGSFGTCASDAKGQWKCWGHISDTSRVEPWAVPIEGVAGVAIEGIHVCAWTGEGRAYCWGDNGEGRVGTGGREPWVHTPAPVIGLENVQHVALNARSSCALLRDGSVWCWGEGVLRPERVSSIPPATAIGSSGWKRCAVAGGALYAADVRQSQPAPPMVLVPEAKRVKAIGSCTKKQICFLDEDDKAHCTPQLETAKEIDAIAIANAGGDHEGRSHDCALQRNGSVTCWGSNTHGQLGDGTTKDGAGALTTMPPVTVRGLNDVVQVAVGAVHSCARVRSGAVFCWGANSDGQLGTAVPGDHHEPARARWP